MAGPDPLDAIGSADTGGGAGGTAAADKASKALSPQTEQLLEETPLSTGAGVVQGGRRQFLVVYETVDPSAKATQKKVIADLSTVKGSRLWYHEHNGDPAKFDREEAREIRKAVKGLRARGEWEKRDSTPQIYYLDGKEAGKADGKLTMADAKTIDFSEIELIADEKPEKAGGTSSEFNPSDITSLPFVEAFDRLRDQARKQGAKIEDLLLLLLLCLNWDNKGFIRDLQAMISKSTASQIQAVVGKARALQNTRIKQYSEELTEAMRDTPDKEDMSSLNERSARITELQQMIQSERASDPAYEGIMKEVIGMVEIAEHGAREMHDFSSRLAQRGVA